MNNNSSFGNVILVIILVLIVGFGVWYFTARQAPAPAEGGIHVDIGGGQQGDGTPAP